MFTEPNETGSYERRFSISYVHQGATIRIILTSKDGPYMYSWLWNHIFSFSDYLGLKFHSWKYFRGNQLFKYGYVLFFLKKKRGKEYVSISVILVIEAYPIYLVKVL